MVDLRHSLLQTLSWCQRVVRISHEEESYSNQSQEYSDFFQDHQPVKGERSILAFHNKQRVI